MSSIGTHFCGVINRPRGACLAISSLVNSGNAPRRSVLQGLFFLLKAVIMIALQLGQHCFGNRRLGQSSSSHETF